jgi:uncharacterized protein YqhQ
MMRTPHAYAVAVRREDGTITTLAERVPPVGERFQLLRWPVLRGSVVLIQAFSIGLKALNFSATIANPQPAPKECGEPLPASPLPETERPVAGSVLFAIAFNLFLFVVLPLFLTNLLFLGIRGDGLLPLPNLESMEGVWDWVRAAFRPARPSMAFHLVEGLVRMSLFLGMVWSFSRLPDIQRIFEYHGAEHKTVFAWEEGQRLTIEEAQGQPRRHPRCGTSFLMVVMLISIGLFSLVRFDSFWINLAARVALIPLLAGLSYEVIKAAGSREGSRIFTWLTQPGLWLQSVTTREPSSDQIEIAIHALRASLALEPSLSPSPEPLVSPLHNSGG